MKLSDNSIQDTNYTRPNCIKILTNSKKISYYIYMFIYIIYDKICIAYRLN